MTEPHPLAQLAQLAEPCPCRRCQDEADEAARIAWREEVN